MYEYFRGAEGGGGGGVYDTDTFVLCIHCMRVITHFMYDIVRVSRTDDVVDSNYVGRARYVQAAPVSMEEPYVYSTHPRNPKDYVCNLFFGWKPADRERSLPHCTM